MGGTSVLESPGFTISYSVKDTVETGQDPTAIAFDPSGSGVAIITQAGESDVTILNASPFPVGPLSAWIDVTPNTLNLELDAHNSLAVSRQRLLDVLVTYNIALSNLERRKDTLLQYNNITIKGADDAEQARAYQPQVH